ncbi:MAG: hypothetical protein AAF386_04795 [Pseudomonadota bacterium]
MIRRAFLAGVCACLALPAAANAVKLTGDEIRSLLTGNTAIGRWDGANYRQWFGPDGVTLFAQDGARTARGQWRVDDDLQEYQSICSGDEDWEGWFVMEFGNTYYWVSRTTPPTPFQIVPGQSLVPE